MASSSRSAWIAGAGAGLIALAALVASAVVLGPGDDRSPRRDHDPDAAESLLEAYRRSRTATYKMESIFQRRLRAGGEFATSTVVVQRPPDRLVISPSAVDGEVAGHSVACSRPEGGGWTCRRGAASDYGTTVDREVEAMRSLVAGPPGGRVYRVRRAGRGCFRLALAVSVPAPPYGRSATLCFDADSGALARSEVRRAEAVDLTVATTIDTAAAVVDAALIVPAPFNQG